MPKGLNKNSKKKQMDGATSDESKIITDVRFPVECTYGYAIGKSDYLKHERKNGKVLKVTCKKIFQSRKNTCRREVIQPSRGYQPFCLPCI